KLAAFERAERIAVRQATHRPSGTIGSTRARARRRDMLTVLAYSMVISFMVLIITKRMSALIALIVIPIVFGVIGGFAAELGPMMLDGVKTLAPTGVMLLFAILYFGVMIDAG